MSNNTERPQDQASPANKDPGQTNGEATKSIYVGFSNAMEPIFAEPLATNNGELPKFDDSTKGMRLVGVDGTEHRFFIPQTWGCFEGAMGEIKKYLYNVSVDWAAREVDRREVRTTLAQVPFQDDLQNYLKNEGSVMRANLPIQPGMIGYPE